MTTPSPEQAIPDQHAPQQTETVKRRMEEHSSEALEIKSAIVKGDLDRAKRAAAWLAESEWTSNLRKDWRPEMQALREAARGVANAVDSGHAAQALARIGNACASCHLAVGAPKLGTEEPPRGDRGPESRGPRHAWATDRMWQGLMAPSDEAWVNGAHVLASVPVEPMGRLDAGAVPSEATLLSGRIHELGRVAQAVDVDRRAAVFGEVISSCASCHTMLELNVR